MTARGTSGAGRYPIGLFDPDTAPGDRTRVEEDGSVTSPSRTSWRAAIKALMRTDDSIESPPKTLGEELVSAVVGLMVVLFLAWFLLLPAMNVLYIANTGPNMLALQPGYLRTGVEWSMIAKKHPVVSHGILGGTYAVVTNNGMSYMATDWDTSPEVLAEIQAILAAQTLAAMHANEPHPNSGEHAYVGAPTP